MKILIADAHPVVRIGLKHHLKQLGDVAFVEAGTGDDAVAALSANRDVTLVICDLAPEGSATDRFKCLRGLRKTNAQVPIIVFSVHEARDIVLKSIDLGARAYQSRCRNTLVRNDKPRAEGNGAGATDSVRLHLYQGSYLKNRIADSNRVARFQSETLQNARIDRRPPGAVPKDK